MTNTDEAPTPEQQPVEQTPTPSEPETPESRLETARRFLQDAAVKDAPRERKVEFLKSKGITDDEIESLLGLQDAEPGEISISPTPEHHDEPRPREQQQQEQEPQQVQAQELEQEEEEQPFKQPAPSHAADHPPIITYPEYLTPPARPPPLLTANAVLNTLYAATGLSTLLYGTKTFLVDPMLSSLTEARLDLHATTSANLAALAEKLESTVSEVPSPATTRRQQQHEDEDSECEDPSELFHRDVGTQTTEPLASPLYPRGPTAQIQEEPATQTQARKLDALLRNLTDLSEGLDGQADDMRGILSVVDTFRDDLRESTVAKSYASLGWRQPEPDDEIKRAKENIRRLKGVFLSTRNFPLSSR